MPCVDTLDLSTLEYRTLIYTKITGRATCIENDPTSNADQKEVASTILDWMFNIDPAKLAAWSAEQWSTIEDYHGVLFEERLPPEVKDENAEVAGST